MQHSIAEVEHVNFQPVTEGLGFHPFSDGLPYAPYVPKKMVKPPGRPLKNEIRPVVSWYFSRRVASYGLDFLFLGYLAFSFHVWSGWSLSWSAFASFFWFFLGVQEVVWATSLGKWCFHLKLEGVWKARLLRMFLFIPSVALFGLGIWMGVFD